VSGLRLFGYCPREVARRLRGVPIALAAALLLALSSRLLPERCVYNEMGRVRAARTGDLALGTAARGDQLARFITACGKAPAPDTSVHRHPYVQKVTAGSADVLWTGARMAAPLVKYWPPAAPETARTVAAVVDRSAPVPRGLQYVASLDGLPAGQVVCYQLFDGRRPLAGPFGFTAAPAAGSPAPIRIVAFGDMGWRSTDQDAVRRQLDQVEFDLVLMAGDIAYPSGRLRDFEENVFPVYGPLMASAFFVPASGNHDYMTADGEPFRQVFALPENGGQEGRERWYSLDWGDLHVVVLDSEKVGEAQEAWLEADLARSAGARWTIALFHKPPFSSGEVGPDAAVRDRLVPILARHRVALVVSGHEHDYERREPVDGVHYLVTGGGGRGTRRISRLGKGSAFAEQVAHFVYLVVTPDEIRLWAIDATGQTFDTARITRPR
jgi:acid phosphatase type 7